MSHIRAEAKLDVAQSDQTFTISTFIEGDNILIATAVGDDGLVGPSTPVRLKVTTASAPQAETKTLE